LRSCQPVFAVATERIPLNRRTLVMFVKPEGAPGAYGIRFCPEWAYSSYRDDNTGIKTIMETRRDSGPVDLTGCFRDAMGGRFGFPAQSGSGKVVAAFFSGNADLAPPIDHFAGVYCGPVVPAADPYAPAVDDDVSPPIDYLAGVCFGFVNIVADCVAKLDAVTAFAPCPVERDLLCESLDPPIGVLFDDGEWLVMDDCCSEQCPRLVGVGPLREFETHVGYVCIDDLTEAEYAVGMLQCAAETDRVISCSVEYSRGHATVGAVAVYSGSLCFLFRLRVMGSPGPALCRLLADPKYVKVGYDLSTSLGHLSRDWGLVVSPVLDLYDVAEDFGCSTYAGLQHLVYMTLGKLLVKAFYHEWDETVNTRLLGDVALGPAAIMAIYQHVLRTADPHCPRYGSVDFPMVVGTHVHVGAPPPPGFGVLDADSELIVRAPRFGGSHIQSLLRANVPTYGPNCVYLGVVFEIVCNYDHTAVRVTLRDRPGTARHRIKHLVYDESDLGAIPLFPIIGGDAFGACDDAMRYLLDRYRVDRGPKAVITISKRFRASGRASDLDGTTRAYYDQTYYPLTGDASAAYADALRYLVGRYAVRRVHDGDEVRIRADGLYGEEIDFGDEDEYSATLRALGADCGEESVE